MYVFFRWCKLCCSWSVIYYLIPKVTFFVKDMKAGMKKHLLSSLYIDISLNRWILLGFTPRRFKDTIQEKNCALGFCTQIGFEATLFVLKNVPSYALRGWPQAFQNHQWGWGQLTFQPHFNDGISTAQSLLVITYSCNWLKKKSYRKCSKTLVIMYFVISSNKKRHIMISIVTQNFCCCVIQLLSHK